MARTNRGYKRNEPFRDATLKVVVGEGKAESQYFASLQSQRVIFFALPFNPDTKSAPIYIIRNADSFVSNFSKAGYDFDRYDELWILIDVDTHGDKALAAAERECREKGYHLAVSNPCFELWLLLHLENFDPNELSRLQGRQAAQSCEQMHRDLTGSYNKSRLNMHHYLNIPLAVERAKALDITEEAWPQQPGTGVYRIFEGNPSLTAHVHIQTER